MRDRGTAGRHGAAEGVRDRIWECMGWNSSIDFDQLCEYNLILGVGRLREIEGLFQ